MDMFSRVKSLSKGNVSKRDPLSSSSNLRDSTAFPLSSVAPTKLTSEDNLTDVPHEKNRFGWAKQIEKESAAPTGVNRICTGRAEGFLVASVFQEYCKGQRGDQYDVTEDDYDYSEETFEQEKTSYSNKEKLETNRMLALEDMQKTDAVKNRRDLPSFEANNSHSNDDLNALLKVIIFSDV